MINNAYFNPTYDKIQLFPETVYFLLVLCASTVSGFNRV